MRQLGRVLVSLTCVAATGCATTPARESTAALPSVARTVYLVRHAEKGTEPANDPPLSAPGQARARALAVALADAGVRSILTTQLLRTRETARPLAEKLGLMGKVVGVSGAAKAHAVAVAAAVKAQPAGAVLVVGHSNTVPLIVEALGGPAMPMICDSQYANLYVVQLWADGKVTMARTEYGARSPDDATCAGMAPR